jgi:hypothetical protein
VIDCDSLEYAQARLQSRHGQRAGEADWQRLETAREFTALLDAARNSPLRPWLVGITAESTSQQIEAVLRAHWRASVSEVAGWMPAAWQAAVRWCAVWPELPVLQHLARGGEPAAWMQDDPEIRALCAVPGAEQAAALAAGPLAPLAGAWPAPESMASAWRAEWQRRLPQPLGDAQDSLAQVAATVRRHGAAFAAAPPGPGSLLRRSLQARLSLLLRRAALEPAAAFIHIALCALDLERLRGELLGRALFAHRRRA